MDYNPRQSSAECGIIHLITKKLFLMEEKLQING